MVIHFTPELTQIIFFDLEFYVPKPDRRRNGYPFKSNPCRAEHLLLGGVFQKQFPLQEGQPPQTDSFWLWQMLDEKAVIQAIYDYFRNAWQEILKRKDHASVIAVGVGISRVDIPFLYAKAVQHKIDSAENLFDCFFNIRTVDLSMLAIPYFRPKEDKKRVLYPKSKNDLLQKFGIEGVKVSGHNVWDAYEARDFRGIEQRTENEVAEIVQLYDQICQHLHDDPGQKFHH